MLCSILTRFKVKDKPIYLYLIAAAAGSASERLDGDWRRRLKEHWNACEGDMISMIEPVWENNQLKKDISVRPCQRDRR